MRSQRSTAPPMLWAPAGVSDANRNGNGKCGQAADDQDGSTKGAAATVSRHNSSSDSGIVTALSLSATPVVAHRSTERFWACPGGGGSAAGSPRGVITEMALDGDDLDLGAT